MARFMYYKGNEGWWAYTFLSMAAVKCNESEVWEDFLPTFIDFFDEHSLPPSSIFPRGRRKVKRVIYDAFKNDKVQE